MKRNLLIEIICCLLIMLFLYTAASKFLSFEQFRGEMNNQPLPNWLTPYLIWSIPLLEMIIAIALMIPVVRKTGLYLSLFLMSTFTIYTGLVLFHFFDRVPCSCGGVIKNLTWSEHMIFNLFFVALSLLGIYMLRKRKDPSTGHRRSLITGHAIRQN